jgi:hypothetical protein
MLSYYANILKSYSQKAALFMPVTCGRPNETWAGQFLVVARHEIRLKNGSYSGPMWSRIPTEPDLQADYLRARTKSGQYIKPGLHYQKFCAHS